MCVVTTRYRPYSSDYPAGALSLYSIPSTTVVPPISLLVRNRLRYEDARPRSNPEYHETQREEDLTEFTSSQIPAHEGVCLSGMYQFVNNLAEF